MLMCPTLHSLSFSFLPLLLREKGVSLTMMRLLQAQQCQLHPLERIRLSNLLNRAMTTKRINQWESQTQTMHCHPRSEKSSIHLQPLVRQLRGEPQILSLLQTRSMQRGFISRWDTPHTGNCDACCKPQMPPRKLFGELRD